MEVAVALRELRPEFAGDLHQRLHAGAIHPDGIHFFACGPEGIQVILAPHVLVPFAEDVEGVAQNFVVFEFRLGPGGSALFNLERLAISQVIAKTVHHLAEHAIGVALVRFIGTNLVDEVVDNIAEVHGIEHAKSEIDGELQAGLSRSGLDAVAVFEKQHAEAIEAGILKRKAILGFIHAEAARPARTRRKEDIVIQNLPAREAFFLQELEILHQVADGEVRGIALPVVAELLAGLKAGDVRHGQLFATIAAALEDGANQVLMFPGEAAEKNRYLIALFGGEGALYGTMEMVGLIEPCDFAQPHAFRFQALLDFGVIFNLDEIRRHTFLRR